jgi:hypothetical protein
MGGTGAAVGGKGHTEREDDPWIIQIPDHPQRADSDTYKISRPLMHAIIAAAKAAAAKQAEVDVVSDFFLGHDKDDFQDHHGGGLWVKDPHGWMLLKNLAGMEWSQQFCADPKKVEKLRQVAERVYAAFPDSLPALKALLGDKDAKYQIETILHEEIDTGELEVQQAKVARWVDSIFNASVPLYATRHTGVLAPNGHAHSEPAPQLEGGVHHYPTPITDIQLFKHDDFQLWVMDNQGELAAVTPAHPRGSGKSEVNVAYATPGTQLHKRWMRNHEKGQHLTLPGNHPMAQQAFADQPGEAAAPPAPAAPAAEPADA